MLHSGFSLPSVRPDFVGAVGRRRTGSTAFTGISGRFSSTEWFAGVGFVAAWIQSTGVVIVVIGVAATVYAQLDMG